MLTHIASAPSVIIPERLFNFKSKRLRVDFNALKISEF